VLVVVLVLDLLGFCVEAGVSEPRPPSPIGPIGPMRPIGPMGRNNRKARIFPHYFVLSAATAFLGRANTTD
jgi:hypothetical protein